MVQEVRMNFLSFFSIYFPTLALASKV